MKTKHEFLVDEALAYEADAFDADEEVSGADLVEWFSHWRERAKVAMGITAHPAAIQSQDDERMRFRNFYRHCGQEWEDTWSCACNDECPVCGGEIEPYDSVELEPASGEEGA